MKSLATAALIACLTMAPAHADGSLWHCLSDDNALVLLASGDNNLTVFDADGVEKFSMKLEYTGTSEDGTIYNYKYTAGKYLFLFMRQKGEMSAGFAIMDMDLNVNRIWMCK